MKIWVTSGGIYQIVTHFYVERNQEILDNVGESK